MAPLLITTPHSSGFAPFDILAQMLGPAVHTESHRRKRLAHLLEQGDPYTDAIFYLPGAQHLHASVSRFVVDLNRPRDSHGENGVIKVTDFTAAPLYPEGFTLSAEDTETRLRRYWDPYHRAVAETLARPDIHFFIDGHAMSPLGPAIGPDQGRPRPALCLVVGGLKSLTTVPEQFIAPLRGALREHFQQVFTLSPELGEQVLVNDPFVEGGLAQFHSDRARQVHKPGFMVEVNRALYLEPDGAGSSRPIPGRIDLLNDCFKCFVDAVSPLMAAEASRAV